MVALNMCEGGPYRFCFFVFDFGRFRNSFFRRSIFFPLITTPTPFVVLLVDAVASLRGRPMLITLTTRSSLRERKQNTETTTRTTLSVRACFLCKNSFFFRFRDGAETLRAKTFSPTGIQRARRSKGIEISPSLFRLRSLFFLSFLFSNRHFSHCIVPSVVVGKERERRDEGGRRRRRRRQRREENHEEQKQKRRL